MIPQRVKLSGFLCYQEEQEIRFDGSQLWMLSGLNGSGKSSVFDAMTYALFGHHRGGAVGAVELINKESKVMAVEFDFIIDDVLYQIRRTLKRAKSGSGTGSQQIYRRVGDEWQPVAGTQLKAQYDEWVREHIGLNYETFTSSVLLLQGKAEKLLDSKPSGRAEVLASIVDLERYQKLHEKSDVKRKAYKSQLDALTQHYEVVPDVSDMELVGCRNRIEDAEDAKNAAAATVDRLQQAEFSARQWGELQAKSAKLRERLHRDEIILADAKNIEKAFQRLRELREVLPHIGTILSQKSQKAQCERDAAAFASDFAGVADRLHDAERSLEGHRKKRASLERTLEQDEKRQREVEAELRKLAGVMAQLREIDGQQSALDRIAEDIARLPKDPQTDVDRWKKAVDERFLLVKVVPTLERFADARQKLAEANRRTAASQRELAQVQTSGEDAKKRKLAVEAELKEAGRRRAEADDAATAARTLLEQAREVARDFQQFEGAKVCRHCGQPLTPAHFQVEKLKREDEARAAEKSFVVTRAEQQKAVREEATFREQFTTAEGELLALREQFAACRNDVDQSKKAGEQAVAECRKAFFDLPESYRDDIATDTPDNWVGTVYPTAREIVKLKNEAGDFDGVRRSLEEAQKVQSKWASLHAKAQSVGEALERLKKGLPAGDPNEFRNQHTLLQPEEGALKTSLAATRKALQGNQAELDRGAKDIAKLQQTMTELKGKIATAEVSRQNCQENIERARQLLPASWQAALDRAGLAEQLLWKNELDDLIKKNVEQRYKDLEAARLGLETLRREIGERDQEAEAFPPDARRDAAVVREELAAAKLHVKACDDRLRACMTELNVLMGHREQREHLRSQTLELEREYNLYKLMSELLGRDRLQRHLVRRAERQIVDYANGVLDRLSGGQLFLRLCGGGENDATERALDLEAFNRTTGGAAINVAFLSGSQRFRVAVSLALGIGQYASRQHRPIESVIIDEGFGCLDRQGRQGMIQELQNLRGHLQCILLVSHQEEFAEAFADGYKFELQDGSTRVTRFAH